MKFHTEIVLHSFGKASGPLLLSLIPILKEQFRMDTVVGERLPIPSFSYDRLRAQYLSTAFLEQMQERFRSDPNIHLGMTDVDLYVPSLAFVFGEASPATWTAIFSLTRLDPQKRDAEFDGERLKRRAATEAVHELGHVLGLQHCSNPRCVMWFSNRIEESDRKGNQFCTIHRKEIDDLLGEWSSQAPPHYRY